MNNIILCGFMGSGKTTAGKLVAKKMNMKFIDTDEYIESKFTMNIKEIFDKYSEDYFRKIEREVVKNIYLETEFIISTGGGIILDIENYNLLKNSGKIIFLNLPFDKILNRIKNDDSRPLLSDGKKTIENLYLQRIEIYRSRADVILDASGSPQDVCGKIIDVFKLLV